jgi:hypothetical protein
LETARIVESIIITDDYRVDNIVFGHGINHHFHTRIWFYCLGNSSYEILAAAVKLAWLLVSGSSVARIKKTIDFTR